MNEKEGRSNPFTSLFGFILIGLLVAGVWVYAMNWVNVENKPETTSVEIKTGEMKEAADDAIDSGEKLIENAGKAIEAAGETFQEEMDDSQDATSNEQRGDNAGQTETERSVDSESSPS